MRLKIPFGPIFSLSFWAFQVRFEAKTSLGIYMAPLWSRTLGINGVCRIKNFSQQQWLTVATFCAAKHFFLWLSNARCRPYIYKAYTVPWGGAKV